MDMTFLKDRWESDAGRAFVNAVLNPKITRDEYKASCLQFFKQSDSIIVSTTTRGRNRLEDLRGMNLSRRDLSDLVFAIGDLSFANLEACILDGVTFSASHLAHASLKGSYAKSGVDFFQCCAGAASFEAVEFTGANFCNADLRTTNFSNAILIRCNLESVQLQGAILDGLTMVDCKVAGLQIDSHQINAAWFRQSTFIDVDRLCFVAGPTQ